MATDVATLQAKLQSVRGERENVERKLQEMRQPRRVVAPDAPPPPLKGSLFSRLGLPVSRNEEETGPRGGRAAGAERERPPAFRRREREGDDEEDEGRRRKRLRSAVAVPAGNDAVETAPVQDDDRWDGGATSTNDNDGPPRGRGERRARGGAVVGLGRVNRPKRDPEAELKAEERGEVKEIYQKQDVQQRSKRLFGALMGHLGKAQKRLDQDKDFLEKQQQRESAVAEKEKEESQRLRQVAREGHIKERQKEEKKRLELLLEQRKIEKELELARFTERTMKYKGFIRTKTEPRLYFLPKTMSDATRALLAENEAELEAAVEEKRKEQEQFLAEMEANFKKRMEGRVRSEGEEKDEEGEEGGDKKEEETNGEEDERPHRNDDESDSRQADDEMEDSKTGGAEASVEDNNDESAKNKEEEDEDDDGMDAN